MAITLAAILTLRDQFSAQFKTAAASAKSADTAFASVQTRLSALSGVMRGDFSQLQNVVQGINPIAIAGFGAIAAGAGAAISEMRRINDETIAYADNIRKVSAAANVSGGWLSSFTEVADDFAVSQQSVNTALQLFSRNIGSGTAATALTQYGISLTDATGKLKNVQQLMPEVADAFQRLGPSAEASALAMQLFGRGGAEMIPVLTQGSAALRDFQQAATQSGIAMSDAALKQAEALRRLRDETADMKTAAERSIFPVTSTVEMTWAQLQIQTMRALRGEILASQIVSEASIVTQKGVAIAYGDTTDKAEQYRQSLISLGLSEAEVNARMAEYTAATAAAARASAGATGSVGQLTGQMYSLARAVASASGAARNFGNVITQFSPPKLGMTIDAIQNLTQKGVAWGKAYGETFGVLEAGAAKVAGGFGGMSAAADMAAGRISAVTGAFSAGASQLDDNAKLNTALSVATGQLSIADFAQTKAAQALSEAYKSGAINMQEAIGVTAALAKGTISTADAFQIAGDIGKNYSAEVQAVSDAVAGGATALKGITSKAGVALSDAALGAFSADLNKTVTATVNVIGIDRVNAAKDALKGLKDTVTSISITANVKTQKDDID